jgi:hypothetical protein
MPIGTAPYKTQKRGDKFVVVDKGGKVMGAFATQPKAAAFLQTLTKKPGKGAPPFFKLFTKQKSALEMSAEEIEQHERDFIQAWAPNLAAELAKAASVSAEDRRKMAKAGTAMPDGSFPIPDESHLRSAMRLARTDAQRTHVKKRASALGKSDWIPDSWK